ncbi:MAG: HAD family hydrolase [Firmicutes bacterium]|nr:HAD family hydrolase [Bacillota bacterium]
MFDGIEWLFFDMGSTLIDESAEYERRLKIIARSAKIPYKAVYAKTAELYGEHFKGDTEVAKVLGVSKPQWDSNNETVYPDTSETLKTLNQKYRIGIIANQPEGAERRLKKFGIMPYVSLVVSSFEIGIEKPDLEIFETALDRAGCRAEHSVMIGDRVDNDIIPAKSLGMRTVWIKQGFGRFWKISDESERADVTVERIRELLTVL